MTGAPCAHGQVHDFGDFRGVGFGERAAEDGEVLREDVYQAAVDAAIAGDEAVAGRALRFHAEIVGVVADEFVELFEGAFVEQQVDAFAGAELALLVFALAALGAAAGFGFALSLRSSSRRSWCLRCGVVTGVTLSEKGVNVER